ncbi:MAG TPA: hypothetical protein VI937_00885 [Negativicutes bacterium]|nr:hypothetical protein [Negativicutes bacterium]
MKISSVFLVLGMSIGVIATIPMPASADTAYCTPNATKQCVSNIVYWYNSCGALQSIAQNCNLTGQICQNAQCVFAGATNPNPAPTPTPSPQPTYDQNAGQNTSTISGQIQQNPASAQTIVPTLAVSLFAKKESETLQWVKTLGAQNQESITFLAVVKNAGSEPINNVSLVTGLAANVAYTGNLKINNTDAAGNLATGISLGTLAAKESKVVTFTASAQNQAAQTTSTIAASVTSDAAWTGDQDTVGITTPAGQSAATTGVTDETSSSFMEFLKKWYVWIIITAVLAVLFVVIFRRLSSSV